MVASVRTTGRQSKELTEWYSAVGVLGVETMPPEMGDVERVAGRVW